MGFLIIDENRFLDLFCSWVGPFYFNTNLYTGQANLINESKWILWWFFLPYDILILTLSNSLK